MTDTTENRETRLRRVLEEAQRESMARDRRCAEKVSLAGAPRLYRADDWADEGGFDPFDNVPV